MWLKLVVGTVHDTLLSVHPSLVFHLFTLSYIVILVQGDKLIFSCMILLNAVHDCDIQNSVHDCTIYEEKSKSWRNLITVKKIQVRTELNLFKHVPGRYLVISHLHYLYTRYCTVHTLLYKLFQNHARLVLRCDPALNLRRNSIEKKVKLRKL